MDWIPQEEKPYVFGLIAGVVLATLFFYLLLFYLYIINAPLCPQNSWALVTLRKGEKIESFLKKMEQNGIKVNPFFFRLYIKLTGHSKDLKAGEYMVSTSQSIKSLAQALIKGKTYLRTVTVWEGMDMFDIAHLLVQTGILSQEKGFINTATNPVLLKKLKVPGKSAEGFLFPETYRFPKGFPASRIVETMVNTFWNRIPPDLKEKKRPELYKIVILASIIQKETSLKEEMPLVSSVYHNRLKRGMRLQADPTVIYAIKLKYHKKKTRLSKEDLRINSPYNTYLHKGLPPGPICNPGLDALEAAAHPAKTGYLYFVAKGDGSHVFSYTLAEHNRAVARYIRELKKQREATLKKKGNP